MEGMWVGSSGMGLSGCEVLVVGMLALEDIMLTAIAVLCGASLADEALTANGGEVLALLGFWRASCAGKFEYEHCVSNGEGLL